MAIITVIIRMDVHLPMWWERSDVNKSGVELTADYNLITSDIQPVEKIINESEVRRIRRIMW